MDLTITYGELRITCDCAIYGDSLEVEEITCPDFDYEVSDFVADRYEKDQGFALTIQNLLRREYHMVLGERAAGMWEDGDEMVARRLMAAGGGR